MKKLLLIPLLALCACSSKYYEVTYASDFTPYVKEGFHIYPEGTDIKTKNYIPLANISVSFHVGKPSKNMKVEDGLIQSEITNNLTPTGEYMMKKIVNEAKSYGADAIINFKVEAINHKGLLTQFVASGTAVTIE